MIVASTGTMPPEAGMDTEVLGVQGTFPGLLPLHLPSSQEGVLNPSPPEDAIHILESMCGALCVLQDETRKDRLRSCASCNRVVLA